MPSDETPPAPENAYQKELRELRAHKTLLGQQVCGRCGVVLHSLRRKYCPPCTAFRRSYGEKVFKASLPEKPTGS